MTENSPLWTPSSKQIADSRMSAFARSVETSEGLAFPNYNALHKWSCQDGGKFWDRLWDFAGVIEGRLDCR
jgi:acetoacetyl-CoA synthetase